MGAAAAMGGAMENLLSNNSNLNPDGTRRSSTPGPSGNSGSGGGFSSIFNFKSVMNAATKPTVPQPAPPTSSFFVPSPPVAQEPIAVDSHSHAAAPQRSVQGTVGYFPGFL